MALSSLFYQWRLNRTIQLTLTLTFILLSLSSQAEDLVFENEIIKFVISSDATPKSIFEKKTQNEWLHKKHEHFFQIKKDGKVYTAKRAEKKKDLLKVTFAGSGVTADYRITTKQKYFVIELVAIHGGEIQQISLGKIIPAIAENIGSWLAVRWNKKFAISWIGLSDRVHTNNTGANVYPEYGMVGEKVALIAAPKPHLIDIIKIIEKYYNLPAPTLNGQWAKQSDDIRHGYLFTDLTPKNMDETIRLAKLGGFKYILVYSSTWSSSRGSYPINKKNFPNGEISLKTTINKVHKAGLKVGMHMLTSFVSKNDSLVTPTPDPRLLKDAEVILAQDIEEKTKNIVSKTPLDQFTSTSALYGVPKQGFDIQIGNEIIHCRSIGGADEQTLLKCIRGYHNTKKVTHRAGDTIYLLSQRHNNYLVDLRTNLKDEVAERIAGIINRTGFDMIYFDGGEVNSANGLAWYWVSQQQMAIWKRVKRDLLVQGSGGTPWNWHIFARSTSDDFAAVAPKQFLDYHKILDSWESYRRNFMPAELGWWGFLDDQPDHPATSPDEVEFYATRMMALDTPVSLETTMKSLKANGRTDELLGILSRYEKLRLGNDISPSTRRLLRTGEWHLSSLDGKPVFQPIRYAVQRAQIPGKLQLNNQFLTQPVKFSMRVLPSLTKPDDPKNIILFNSISTSLQLPIPNPDSAMPGALAGRVEFIKPKSEHHKPALIISDANIKKLSEGKALNLLKHRALAITLSVDQAKLKKDGKWAVLNIQLESNGQRFREHYINLDFVGEKTIIIPEPTTERMLPEFRPSAKNYHFKLAGYTFDYGKISALNFRWMQLPGNKKIQCSIKRVVALQERPATLKNPVIKLGKNQLMFPVNMNTGDYLEFRDAEQAQLYDRNGNLLKKIKPQGNSLQIPYGISMLEFSAESNAPVKWTTITLGKPLAN